MTTTQMIERETLYQKIRDLPDSAVMRVIDFIDSIGGNEPNDDPFYGESNMRHLRAVKSDVQTGLNMSAHELIEVDND